MTHKDLFLEHPVKLPFLGIDLPLTGFFALGPVLFLILHTYVLLHFVLLAGKVAAFDRELSAQLAGDDEAERRTNLRRQLPSNIFIQFLAGPSDVRERWLGWALRAIAWISLVFGPVLLLVFFQFRFLPYHNAPLTWWHRIAVVLDIFLLWWLWPKIVLATGDGGGTRWARIGSRAMKVASVLLVLLVWRVATFPGEMLHEVPGPAGWVPRAVVRFLGVNLEHLGPASLHEVLFAGEVDQVNRRPTSLFSNVLVLPGVEAYDPAKFDEEKKFATVRETISLRGRHLEGAVLIDARLRKADLTGAFLQSANLTRADLRDARLECAPWSTSAPKPDECAQLQGATLNFALLSGAWLDRAQLQGASLNSAKFNGASLNHTQLQGASLSRAQFQGASLIQAHLQAAVLDYAQMQGAALIQAQLQGASLVSAQLQGVRLGSACVWRADLRAANTRGVAVGNLSIHAEETDKDIFVALECKWTVERRISLRAYVEHVVAAGWQRDLAIQRLDHRLRPDPPKKSDRENDLADNWLTLAAKSRDEPAFIDARRQAGCDADNAPYVARGLLGQIYGSRPEEWERKLADGLLDPGCAGAAKLTDEEKQRLARIRDWAPPTTPGR